MDIEARHDPVLRHYNEWLAQVFWYTIAALLGTFFPLRLFTEYYLYPK
jgi:hypothetical protein